MNWKQEAIKDLKNYPFRVKAIQNTVERIKILEEQFVTLRGLSKREPIKGGTSRQEEQWLENITERERLGFSLEISKSLIELTEKGLGALSKKEQRVLEGFYINHRSVDELCRELGFERSSIYRIRDEALRKFTIAEYGIVEL